MQIIHDNIQLTFDLAIIPIYHLFCNILHKNWGKTFLLSLFTSVLQEYIKNVCWNKNY